MHLQLVFPYFMCTGRIVQCQSMSSTASSVAGHIIQVQIKPAVLNGNVGWYGRPFFTGRPKFQILFGTLIMHVGDFVFGVYRLFSPRLCRGSILHHRIYIMCFCHSVYHRKKKNYPLLGPSRKLGLSRPISIVGNKPWIFFYP